jgi:hypothetical protein
MGFPKNETGVFSTNADCGLFEGKERSSRVVSLECGCTKWWRQRRWWLTLKLTVTHPYHLNPPTATAIDSPPLSKDM